MKVTHLSTPVFVTETVSPIQMAEPATGCYLKAVPCEIHKDKSFKSFKNVEQSR